MTRRVQHSELEVPNLQHIAIVQQDVGPGRGLEGATGHHPEDPAEHVGRHPLDIVFVNGVLGSQGLLHRAQGAHVVHMAVSSHDEHNRQAEVTHGFHNRVRTGPRVNDHPLLGGLRADNEAVRAERSDDQFLENHCTLHTILSLATPSGVKALHS